MSEAPEAEVYAFGNKLAALRARPAPIVETVAAEVEDKIEEVSESRGFTSRQAQTRVKRQRSNEPIEILSVKGPLSVLNRFKEYANANGHSSYWTALDALLRASERKR